MQEQVAQFTHTCFTVTPYEGYVEVCEALNELTPGDFDKRTALFNSGAEAVENAVKIARRFTGRDAVVVFDHAYHGRTNLTMAMTAKNMPYKDGFGPFAGEIYRAPMSYPFREPAPITGEQAAARAIDVIEKQVGADRVAAVVIEPIQGEGGFIVARRRASCRRSASWCTAHDVLFIADEIQSGFARTGAMFAVEHEGVVPDLVTTAKGIAGGLPLAAVTGRADVMDAVHPADSAAPTAATRSPARPRSARSDHPGAGPGRRRPADRVRDASATGGARGQVPADRRGTRAGRDARDRDRAARDDGPRRRADRPGRGGLPPGRSGHPHLRHLRQRAAFPAARW